MIIAFILTKDEYTYERWLKLVNDGENILMKDRINFPRITKLEQALAIDPKPMVYTYGNHFVNDKMMRLEDLLKENGFKVIPTPTEAPKVGVV